MHAKPSIRKGIVDHNSPAMRQMPAGLQVGGLLAQTVVQVGRQRRQQ